MVRLVYLCQSEILHSCVEQFAILSAIPPRVFNSARLEEHAFKPILILTPWFRSLLSYMSS